MLPKYSMYYVTDWCNAKCSFCNIWENPIYKGQSLEMVERNIVDLKRLGVQVTDFTGGEPFMRRDLPKIFELAEKHGMKYIFTNNGSLFLKRWDEIKHLSPFHFSFSLDSSRAKEHDEHRKIPGLFKKIEAGVYRSHSIGWRPSIIFTVTKQTYDQIGEMIDLMRSWDCHVSMTPVFEYGDLGTNGLTREQLLSMKKLNRNPRVSVDPDYIDFILKGGNDTKDRTCRSMDIFVVVAPDGSLYTPCYHASNYQFPTDDGLFNAVTSPKWKELSLKAGTYDFCEGCTVYCYMDASLFFKHPIRHIAPAILHLFKIRSRWGEVTLHPSEKPVLGLG